MKHPKYRENAAQGHIKENDLSGLSPEERTKRVLNSMPEHIFNNPTLRLRALRAAQRSQPASR